MRLFFASRVSVGHETEGVMMLTIGKLAHATGVTPDTLRYYEKEGLVRASSHTEAGYRLFGNAAVQRVRFVKRAQLCGFTLSEIADLITLQSKSDACCGDVRSRAIEKKLSLEGKIRVLQKMSRALDALLEECPPAATTHPVDECPILAALEGATVE